MSWKFNPGDNYDLKQLESWKDWFETDLKAAEDWITQVSKMPNALPGKQSTLKIAREYLKVSERNLIKCKAAIELAKGRQN